MVNHAATYLYRLFDGDGSLLYVGITCHLEQRMKEHAAAQHWWPLVAARNHQLFTTRGAAEAAERLAILGENPVYNKAGRGSSPVCGRDRSARYWQQCDITGWSVVSVESTPTGTVDIRLRHKVWGEAGRVLTAPSLKEAKRTVGLWAVRRARTERRHRIARARGDSLGRLYEFPRQSGPSGDAPEDLAA